MSTSSSRHSSIPSSPVSSGYSTPTSSSYSSHSSNSYSTNTRHVNSNSNNSSNGHGHSNGHGAQYSPILVLEPVNNTFMLKSLELPDQTKVKIGRQTGVATAPNPTNGYFDSRVLSRIHAEVWSEGNKVYLRDLKSSNGTFLNGRRLCPENTESEVFELNQNDNVEFGIDITDENGVLLHEKVACKVYISRMNVIAGAQHDTKSAASLTTGSGTGTIKSNGSHHLHHEQQNDGPDSNGAAQSIILPGGQSENIDLIFSRLQSELLRAQETHADLEFLRQGISELERSISVAPPDHTSDDADQTGSEDGRDSMTHIDSEPELEMNGYQRSHAKRSPSGSFSGTTNSGPLPSSASKEKDDFDRLLHQKTMDHTTEVNTLTLTLEMTKQDLKESKQQIQQLEHEQARITDLLQGLETQKENQQKQLVEMDMLRDEFTTISLQIETMAEEHEKELEKEKENYRMEIQRMEEAHKEELERIVVEVAQEQDTVIQSRLAEMDERRHKHQQPQKQPQQQQQTLKQHQQEEQGSQQHTLKQHHQEELGSQQQEHAEHDRNEKALQEPSTIETGVTIGSLTDCGRDKDADQTIECLHIELRQERNENAMLRKQLEGNLSLVQELVLENAKVANELNSIREELKRMATLSSPIHGLPESDEKAPPVHGLVESEEKVPGHHPSQHQPPQHQACPGNETGDDGSNEMQENDKRPTARSRSPSNLLNMTETKTEHSFVDAETSAWYSMTTIVCSLSLFLEMITIQSGRLYSTKTSETAIVDDTAVRELGKGERQDGTEDSLRRLATVGSGNGWNDFGLFQFMTILASGGLVLVGAIGIYIIWIWHSTGPDSIPMPMPMPIVG